VSEQAETTGGVMHVRSYTYDADGQVVEVRRDGVLVEEYAYDDNGNRTQRRLNGGATEVATYDVQDRLIARGAVAYQFDAAGFMTARGADTFAYDTAGELLAATVGGDAVAYAYDGLRRRVARTDAAGTHTYYYGDPALTAEITASRDPAGVLTVYYYDRGRLFGFVRGGAWYYVATDLVGSPRVVVDATGAPVETIEYDAFGKVLADSNPGFDLPVGFAGGLADRLTGLVRFGFRDYDPAAGRWTARDPMLFDGGATNLYRYAANDPGIVLDPTGLASLEVSAYEGIGAGFKLAVNEKGVSACVEAGPGVGRSVEFDLLDDLDGNTFGLKGEASGKLGPAKLQGNLEMNLQTDDFGKGDCGPDFKGELKICGGALCAGGDTDRGDHASADVDVHADALIPSSGIGEGAEAKFVGRLCQQVKW
jgi:RHS repeat-associated protein